MSEITLELVESKQSELADMIGKLKHDAQRKASATTRRINAADLVLYPDETYCGEVLDEKGRLLHWLVIVAVRDERTTWDKQKAWAESLGADLPSPAEAHLAHANAKHRMPKTWIWLNKLDGSADAWRCCSYGSQHVFSRSAEGGAVAVRRVFPSTL